MKLEKFKEKDSKRIGIIIFTVTCILLISGAILYRTFAIFEVKTSQNVIKGTVQDPGDVYFAFYYDGSIQKNVPDKSKEYVLDEEQSYCEVLGNKDESIFIKYNFQSGAITVNGVKNARTKCNLYFTKGEKLIDKISKVSEEDGLYSISHGEEVDGTLNDEGFKQIELRYAGSNPKNYIKFNDELWRIIGLVNVLTTQNQVEQRIKIVFSNYLEQLRNWSLTDNNWVESDIKRFLNESYFINLNDRDFIEENIRWTLSGWNTNRIHVSEMYVHERTNNVYNGYPVFWEGQIGLMNISDYGYATSDKTCIDTINLFEYNNVKCTSNNWLYFIANNKYKPNWFITPLSTSNNTVFIIDEGGRVNYNTGTNQLRGIEPTLYLKSNVLVNSNTDGSETNPYTIS